MNLDPDKLIKAIDRRIEFWRQPQADARVAQSVMVALAEVKEAIKEVTTKRKARPIGAPTVDGTYYRTATSTAKTKEN